MNHPLDRKIYFFVSQNMSPISSKAALNSLAFSMSTFTFTNQPNLHAFHIFECKSGYFSKCSGLK